MFIYVFNQVFEELRDAMGCLDYGQRGKGLQHACKPKIFRSKWLAI